MLRQGKEGGQTLPHCGCRSKECLPAQCLGLLATAAKFDSIRCGFWGLSPAVAAGLQALLALVPLVHSKAESSSTVREGVRLRSALLGGTTALQEHAEKRCQRLQITTCKGVLMLRY